MRDTTVASRYARALFIVTEKHGETVRALEDLKGLLEVLVPRSQVSNFLASPGIRLVDKRTGLKKALEKHVLRVVVVFLDLLLRKKRLTEFATIVTEFEALVEKAQGIQRAHVVSAVALTKPESARLLKALEATTHTKIQLTSEVDEGLLGGAQVRIGDRVTDRSVRNLLESIRQQLQEVSV